VKVRITRQAQADLEEIAEWIGRDNPDRAISFIDELLVRCRSLAEHADRFPVYRELRGITVRKMSHRDYVILYVRLGDRVEVAHIVHGARDLEALLP
jgi:addiction module RelE/StbE family toxin